MPGVVSFKGSLKPIKQFKIGTFYPSGQVFNYSIAELAKDTVFRYETDARVTGKKVFQDKLNIRNLKTIGSYANLSQVPLDGILRFKLNGNLLADQIKCSNFVVTRNLNGMPGDRFGKFWLSMEGDQIFSEHQTFHNLNVERLQLYGHLDENRVKYDINSAMGNSYLTNRREVVPTKTVFGEWKGVKGLIEGATNFIISLFCFRERRDSSRQFAAPWEIKCTADSRGSYPEKLQPYRRATG